MPFVLLPEAQPTQASSYGERGFQKAAVWVVWLSRLGRLGHRRAHCRDHISCAEDACPRPCNPRLPMPQAEAEEPLCWLLTSKVKSVRIFLRPARVPLLHCRTELSIFTTQVREHDPRRVALRTPGAQLHWGEGCHPHSAGDSTVTQQDNDTTEGLQAF